MRGFSWCRALERWASVVVACSVVAAPQALSCRVCQLWHTGSIALQLWEPPGPGVRPYLLHCWQVLNPQDTREALGGWFCSLLPFFFADSLGIETWKKFPRLPLGQASPIKQRSSLWTWFLFCSAVLTRSLGALSFPGRDSEGTFTSVSILTAPVEAGGALSTSLLCSLGCFTLDWWWRRQSALGCSLHEGEDRKEVSGLCCWP